MEDGSERTNGICFRTERLRQGGAFFSWSNAFRSQLLSVFHWCENAAFGVQGHIQLLRAGWQSGLCKAKVEESQGLLLTNRSALGFEDHRDETLVAPLGCGQQVVARLARVPGLQAIHRAVLKEEFVMIFL